MELRERRSCSFSSAFFCKILFFFLFYPAFGFTAEPGVTAGEFSVDASGAANYLVPIAVPPGTAGMQPSLSLSYNSRSGNGILGVGWTLGGLSVITRCPATKFIDGYIDGIDFDSNDRFCIDGQRLIQVTGTPGQYGANGIEYRTEVDGFTQVISYDTDGSNNGPEYFIAKTKSGQILEYGNTDDSRIEAQGKNDVRLWAVNKIQDTVGNYMLVSYYENNSTGEYRPSAINYTANDNAGLNTYSSVVFNYAPRVDISPLYFSGSLIKNTQRLTSITTRSNGNQTTVKNYILSYDNSGAMGRSRLIALSECDAFSKCFGSIDFQYSNNIPTFSSTRHDTIYSGPANFQSHNSHIYDVNNDGLDDVITLYASSCCLGAHVALGLGDGHFGALAGYPLVNGPNMSGYVPQLADINGDGAADIVALQANSNGLDAHVALGNGNGGFGPFQWNPKISNLNFSGHSPQMADVNGDGRDDVVSFYASASGIGAHVALSQGNGTFAPIIWNPLYSGVSFSAYKPRLADVNSDGKVDVVALAATSNALTAHVSIGVGDGNFYPLQFKPAIKQANFSAYDSLRMADVNGDGLKDIIAIALASSGFWGIAAINNGNGSFSEPVSYARLSSGGGNYTPYSDHLGDFNGDGLADIGLVATTSGGLYSVVALSDGKGGFFTPLTNTIHTTGADYSPYQDHLGDFNGDGLTDIGVVAPMNGGLFSVTAPSNSNIPDKLTQISSSLDTKTDIIYKPLTNINVYTKGTGAAYPAIDIQAPINVVSTAKVDNGIGGQRITNYTYAALRATFDGRGSLGFAQMKATDVSTGITTTTNYSQTYPYVGMVERTEQRISTGDLIGEIETIFTNKQTHAGIEVTGSHPGVLFPYAETVIKKDYELD